MAKYDYLLDQLHSKEDVIMVHQGLHGLESDNYYDYQKNEKEYFRDILLRDYCRRTPYEYEEGIMEFINSKYLSDYMKKEVKKISPRMELPESDFKDMTVEDLKKIRNRIRIYYCFHDEEEEENLTGLLDHYLMKLEGVGPKTFVQTEFSKTRLASMILLTSGLFNEGSYYPDENVNRNELNENHLLAIRKKVISLNPKYEADYTELIRSIPILSPRSFIDAFNQFVKNDFVMEDYILDEDEENQEYTATKYAREAYNYQMTKEVKEAYCKKVFQEEQALQKVQKRNCQVTENS
ncbi:MAG: hypothetical protein IJ193_06405 [Bacilli bacterium]|nr:hypothetical protein [Bacilli bacterium]